MALPTSGLATTDTQIEVDWTALTSTTTGNSPILSYNLYWDNGSGTTNLQLIDLLQTSYVVSGLEGGATYMFKVRAKNIYGYGPFSSVASIIPSDIPGQMVAPTIALDSTTSVQIAWQ
jgi:hypothetical protein